MNIHLVLPNLSPQASAFLMALGHGKYDANIAAIDTLLTVIGPVAPEAALIREIFDGLIALNKATAPEAVEPDGQGGYVPSTNSHWNRETGEFLP